MMNQTACGINFKVITTSLADSTPKVISQIVLNVKIQYHPQNSKNYINIHLDYIKNTIRKISFLKCVWRFFVIRFYSDINLLKNIAKI